MNLTVTNYTHTGAKKDSTTLPESIFAAPASKQLLAQAIRVYLSNQRQGTKFVQGRSDVNRTTAKVWKQKGTGRARHGSRKAPTFVGGGQAHGPSGIENYSLTLTKRMRRQAILGALTYQQEQAHVSTIETIDQLEAKTKTLKALLGKINPNGQKVLMILDQPHQNVLRAMSNVPGLMGTQAKRLNVFEVLNTQHLIISKPALEIIEATYGNKDQAPSTKSQTKQTKIVSKKAEIKKLGAAKVSTKKTTAKATKPVTKKAKS